MALDQGVLHCQATCQVIQRQTTVERTVFIVVDGKNHG